MCCSPLACRSPDRLSGLTLSCQARLDYTRLVHTAIGSHLGRSVRSGVTLQGREAAIENRASSAAAPQPRPGCKLQAQRPQAGETCMPWSEPVSSQPPPVVPRHTEEHGRVEFRHVQPPRPFLRRVLLRAIAAAAAAADCAVAAGGRLRVCLEIHKGTAHVLRPVLPVGGRVTPGMTRSLRARNKSAKPHFSAGQPAPHTRNAHAHRFAMRAAHRPAAPAHLCAAPAHLCAAPAHLICVRRMHTGLLHTCAFLCGTCAPL